MHRLLFGLALLILIMPALAPPAIFSAQDAGVLAQDADVQDTDVPALDADGDFQITVRINHATDRSFVQPFTQNPGLNPGLTEAGADEAVCAVSSIVTLDRPDAWSCVGATTQIYDPCFENPFLPPDQQTALACFETPFTTEVVLVTLTAPLVREKGAPAPVMPEPTTEAGVIEPWELPWALELANGDRCSLPRETLMVMAGQAIHYRCADGGLVLGEVDTDDPVWTVNYLADDDFASTVVDVVVAWS